MKVINSKLAAIGLAAFVFASCSDSNSDPGTSPAINPADLTSVALTAQNIDNSRISNYKNSTANARKFFLNTRAGEASFATGMPEDMPKEADYKLKTLNNPGDLEEGKAYLVTSNKTIDLSGKKVKEAIIFVHSGCTLKYNETLGGNKIVLSGGTLEYTGNGAMVAANDIVYCTTATSKLAATGDMVINGKLYAELRSTSSTGNDLSSGIGAIAETTKAEKEKSITPTQNITFGEGALAYINGSIRAKKLTIGNNANVYTKANIFDTEGVTLNGNLKIDGFLQAGNYSNGDSEKKATPADLIVNGYLEAGANTAIKVTGTLEANAGSKIVANYINVTNNPKNADGTQKRDENGKTIAGDATLKLNGACQILLGNKNVINVNNLVTDNAAAGQIELQDNNAVAVIKADKFVNNGNAKIEALSTSGTNGSFLLEFTKSYNGTTELGSFEDLDINVTYVDYDKTTENNLIAYKDENNKNYGYEWTGDASKIVSTQKLDLIASEDTPNDGESATCIQAGSNNKLYVSYHTYGNNKVGGNIEALSMSGNTLTLDQSMAAANCDYNHLIVDGSNLFLAGSQQGNGAAEGTAIGAFLGKVQLNGSSLGNNIELYAIDKKVNKLDANCVAKSGSDYVVATTNGFTIFDKDFNYENNNGTSAGKHVVTANGKLYALTEDGKLSVYNNSEMENGTTYEVGAVSPTGTKAVVAVDTDGSVYVCKGDNGLAKIDAAGNVTQEFFACPTFSAASKNDGQIKGRCNGVAVDGNYVYVACGSYGLVVLNKAGGVVAHRKAYTGKSANYVAVDGNNIYVAYGQSRVQVFKLTATK
nr:hypothetical protein [uncultured Prevotella sp.]